MSDKQDNNFAASVYMRSENVNDSEPITDSLKIAEVFGKRHDNVIRDIRKVQEILTRNGRLEDRLKSQPMSKIALLKLEENSSDTRATYVIEEETYYDDLNRPQVKFILNFFAFQYVVKKYTGKKAEAITLDLLDCFHSLNVSARKRLTARTEGKFIRSDFQIMMDRLKFTPIQMGAYTNHVYNLCFKDDLNKPLKVEEIREIKGITKFQATRDYLTTEELDLVKKFESEVATLTNYMDIEEACDKVAEKFRNEGSIPMTLKKGKKSEN